MNEIIRFVKSGVNAYKIHGLKYTLREAIRFGVNMLKKCFSRFKSIFFDNKLYYKNKKNLTDKKVVYVFPVIDWNFRIQRPQHLCREIVKNGYTIVYISTFFNCTKTPGFSSKLIEENIIELTLNLNRNLNIYKENLNSEEIMFLMKSICAFEKGYGVNNRVSIVDHPFWIGVANNLSGAFTIYDCMDYHAGFGDESKHLENLEEKSIKESDLLVLTSQDLWNRFSTKNRNSVLVRNGCEFEFFNRKPNLLKLSTTKKIIGYYGAISSWFDVDSVCAIASHYKECDIVLIGSTLGCIDSFKFKEYSNIKLLGEVKYSELPSYLYAFDVCIMPFKVIDLTLATNPVKVYEYLSAGKPVVSTRLPEVELMEDVVYTAANAQEFIEQIERALLEDSNELQAKRIDFAKNNDWSSRALNILQAIAKSKKLLPKVSVIILTYNNLELTKKCLESLEKWTNYPNVELILVDNASADETPEFFRNYKSSKFDVRILLNEENLGFPEGNNVGIRIATGEYIVLLNNDTELTPFWIEHLLKGFSYNEKLGLTGPRTNNIGNEARIETSYTNHEQMICFSIENYYNTITALYPIHTLAFFAVMIKKEVFEKIGLLDKSFGIGMFEDDDFCRRAEDAGYEIACVDYGFIHHHLSASFSQEKAEWKDFLFKKNRAIYEGKHGKWEWHTYRKEER